MTFRASFRADSFSAGAAAVGPVMGLDTGTSIANLGIFSRGRPLAGLSRPVSSHCRGLPQAVAQLLDIAGLGLGEIQALAVGIGPGSFTGLRVGLSYAKGLALACERPLLGISTLDSMAVCALEQGAAQPGALLCPLLDARRGEAYAALYRVSADGLDKQTVDLLIAAKELIANVTEEVTFVGENVAAYDKLLIGALGGPARILDLSRFGSRGIWLAAMAAARVLNDDLDSSATLQPFYVRPPQAPVAGAVADNGRRAGTEALWSTEKRNSSGSIWSMMRS